MTGNKSQFQTLQNKDGGEVAFGGKDKGKIIGIGKVGKNSSNSIDDVLLVKGLNHNLLSISQLCDKGYKVMFETSFCAILDKHSNEIKFIGHRRNNVYTIDFDEESCADLCLSASNEDNAWLWHRRLGHASFGVLKKLSRRDLVIGLPKIKFDTNKVCSPCAKGKQTRASFKSKNNVSSKRPLEVLHLDLLGPTWTSSLGGKNYGFVIVDDFSRFT
jgi:GAG-pre-integrase domain/Pol polyprotein, beta-barrel domain